MSISRYIAAAALLTALLTSGCRHTSYNMHLDGAFRFNIMQNDVPATHKTGPVAMNEQYPLPSDCAGGRAGTGTVLR